MPFRSGQLRYFVTVAEYGQITRAARELHIAQPALSQSITQLEAELGLKLLERHARGVTLTGAGEVFLEKARAALASEHDLELAARSLLRGANAVLEIGFIGPPPTINAPELFAAFADANPDVELSFRDMPFPRGRTLAWLEAVDMAFCHRPALEPGVAVQRVRSEPRAVVAHRSHRLADRAELRVADVLDETFIRYDPDVQEEWAGFHSLDDHRGAPPRALTVDRAASSLQMLGIMSTRRAITTVPLSDARLARDVLHDAVAIPVKDATCAELSLVWPRDSTHPLVPRLVALAAHQCEHAEASGDSPAAQ